MNFVIEFLSALIITGVQVYAWHKIADKKFTFLNLKVILAIIILTFYSLINFNNVIPFFKYTMIFIVSIVFCKIILKESIKNSILITFIQQLIVILAETIMLVVFSLILGDNVSKILESYGGTLLVDLLVALLIIIVIKTQKPKKIYFWIVKHIDNIKKYKILILILIIMTCSSSTFALIYYTNNKTLAIIINFIIIILYTFIVLKIIRLENKYVIISNKYNISIESLTAQEKVIDQYRIINHENMNQLNVIKSMSKSQKINNYINSLQTKRKTFNSEIINESLKLPAGGIRGIISQKILYMKHKKIKYFLNVDKTVNSRKLLKIEDSDLVDISQILGVITDNAIEETLKQKDKEIVIDLSMLENILYIKVVNYHNNQNIINSSTLKTTKGKNHGYGLQLVDRIVRKNSRIKNTRQISKNTFTQIVELKIK